MADRFGPNGLSGDGVWAYSDGQVPLRDDSINRFRPAALQQTIVAGAAAGDITVTGIAVGDILIAVTRYIGAGTAVTDVSDLTSEFTITAADTINNGGGTNTTGDKLQVWWWAK